MLERFIVGDVIEELNKFEDGFFDLVITSPPYNKKNKNGGVLVPSVIYDSYSDDLSEDDYQKWQIDVINLIYKKTKDNASFFYNHKVRYEDGKMLHPITWLSKTKWNIWQEIVWDRGITGNIRGWRFWNVDERIYWLVKKQPQELNSVFAQWSSIWKIRPEKDHKIHPAPFPLEIPMRIIQAVLGDKYGIVLDPFCGIGTTALACVILNKGYVCIDISKNYIDYSIKRIEEYKKKSII